MTEAAKQHHAFTVIGHWPFPIDMLRYDQAQPATDADRAAIDRLSSEHAGGLADLREPTLIDLVIPGTGHHQRPHTARWESFGWRVVGDLDYATEKAWKANEALMKITREVAMAKLTPDEIVAIEWHVDRA